MSEFNSPKHLKRKLVKDKAGYFETIGRFDNEAFQSVLDAPGGEGTVIRLFLGATSCMPLRALSYVASAVRLAKTVPCEQIQIISVNKLGEAVNGIPREQSSEQSRLLASVGQLLLVSLMEQQVFRGVRGILESRHISRTIFAEDRNIDHIDQFVPVARKALEDNPALASNLSNKGAKHGGDFVTYGAAHLANQDTALLELDLIANCVRSGTIEPVVPERIVAVGCQQERTFYDLRMAMRKHADPEVLIPSGQVFTRHVSPPYFASRSGEQSLESALADGVSPALFPDHTARRDVVHLNRVLHNIDPTPRLVDMCSGDLI